MSPFAFSVYPGTWHVQCSSRKLWHGKRNVQANFAASNSLDYTYQEHEELNIKTHKDADWEVAGDGKDGKLEGWMTETEAGIVDSSGKYFFSFVTTKISQGLTSQALVLWNQRMLTLLLCRGEIRADWRSRWVAIVFPLNSDPFNGVDILCNRQKEISDETVKEILSVLESKCGQFLGPKQMVLLKVPDDGARNAEMGKADEQRRREWEKRTGEKDGISEDLIYDDVKEKEGSRCGLQ
jgi:hypothetical protein